MISIPTLENPPCTLKRLTSVFKGQFFGLKDLTRVFNGLSVCFDSLACRFDSPSVKFVGRPKFNLKCGQ